MRIWQINDLHLTLDQVRSDTKFGEIPEADLAVVVGDVSDHVDENLEWCARNILPYMPTVYVPGNHDLYQRCINGCTDDIRANAARLGLVYLDRDTAVVNGIRLTGGLLWSNYELWTSDVEDERQRQIEERLAASVRKSDYERIYSDKSTGRYMTPWESRARHIETIDYISDVLDTPFDGETVVVTHFPPHPGSMQKEYMGDCEQPRYLSDHSSLIEGRQPAAWLHGHTHQAVSYRVGRTLVANNPRGYEHESTGFDWQLVHTI